MTIDTTVLSVLFAFFGAFYSLLLVAIILARRRQSYEERTDDGSTFSLLVPARNEASVIEATLASLLAFDYPPDRFEVLVVDDGSTDGTSEAVRRLARQHAERVHVLRVPVDLAGRGKSEALNLGLRALLRSSRFRDSPSWIVGVFDADGVADRDLLRKAAFQFRDESIGGVQASVRIANRGRSRLARMQDLEFSAFSRVTQMIRSQLVGSASLGGNGQFVRAKALRSLRVSGKPSRFWRPGALTEDLELSTRLALAGWKIRHLATSYVHQEGVERFRDLFRQRTRWAWGSLQVFVEYVLKLKIARAKGVPLRTRLDLGVTLSLFILSPMVLVVWLLTILSFAGVLSVTNQLPGLLTLGISFGFFPVVAWGMWQQREYRRLRLPLDLLLFTAYTYHWLPCLYVAILRVIGGDDSRWFKTRRISEGGGALRPRLVDRVAAWAKPPNVAGLAAFLVLAAVAGFLRWQRGGYLDPFEDAYQHWWISGYTLQTGQYYDSFSAMTHGNWLPLYDFAIMPLFSLFGVHNMGALKGLSLALSLATMAIVFLVGLRSLGRGAAWAAAVFFAFMPSGILGGSMALPEAATGLALIGAYYLMFLSPAPSTSRYGFAAAALLIAVALRYEAWLFTVLLLGFYLGSKAPKIARGDLLLVTSPALVFMGVWLLFTSRWGFLPNIVIAQTSVDLQYKASIGALPAISEILGDFWRDYASLSLVPVFLGTAYAIRSIRREFLAFVLLAFYAAEVGWTGLGYGTPSVRYLYVTLPGLTVLAGMAVASVWRYARSLAKAPGISSRRVHRGAAVAVAVLLVAVVGISSVHDGLATAFPSDNPGFMMGGRERAGLFLRDLALPTGKLLLSESPIAAYLSGQPPGRIIGSSLLPDNATAAAEYLQENVAYLVLVTVPWYKLRRLFPELADGANTPEFRLLFDATGPEYVAGGHRVLVYEVLPRSGGIGP